MHYKTALIMSEALRIRHEKINNKWLILDAETQNAINNALLIGLESYGEVERISNEIEVEKFTSAMPSMPDSVSPIHPIGSAGTIGVFAAALRYMQQA